MFKIAKLLLIIFFTKTCLCFYMRYIYPKIKTFNPEPDLATSGFLNFPLTLRSNSSSFYLDNFIFALHVWMPTKIAMTFFDYIHSIQS